MQKSHNGLSYPWLPYVVAAAGIALSALTGYYTPTEAAQPLTRFYPWFILIAGILLSILIGVIIQLLQLARAHKLSEQRLDENFKNEMAERIEAEKTQQKLEKALLQGQKLQAMGTLAGGIAHDFNNIIYAIIGYAELAREDISKDSLIYKNLGKVLEGCKRGQELVARILTFSRRQHHDFKPICIKETLEGVLSLLKPTIPATVTIHFESMPDD